ncbi:MAG: right-handed parallel beta-helix repeat-containing protein [Candidatus Krumholzibacteriia bacterium]
MLAGCGSEDPPVAPSVNQAPTIQFTFDKLAVGTVAPVNLTVAVDDTDGDPLTVAWTVTRSGNPSGIIVGGQGTPALAWESPSVVGEDVIVATVSDGNGGQRSVTETLKVGTVQTADVLSSQTWIRSKSPYILRPGGATFAVDPAAVLTVAQGVEILVDNPGLDFQVQGALVTNGTSGAPVVLGMNSRNPSPGDWGGISAVPNGPTAPQVTLNNTTVTHAQNAVFTTSAADAQLDGCWISQCSAVAILHESTGSLAVTNSAITNNKASGIKVDGGPSGTAPASVTIQGDSIAINGELTSPNTEAGISLIFDDPLGLAPITISGNTISRNFVPGIALGSPALPMALYPAIFDNNLSGNEFGKASPPRHNLLLQLDFNANGVFATTLDARNNWWGQPYPSPSDSTFIRDTIRDRQDNPGSIGVWVLVDPWLQGLPQ